jgi:hypothetical protein
MRERVSLFGHSHDVECAPGDVDRVRELSFLLESRMKRYMGEVAVDNMTMFTEALLVTGLRMEQELRTRDGEREREFGFEERLEEMGRRLEDVVRERDSVQDKYDELKLEGESVLKRVRVLEEGLGRLLRRMEGDADGGVK